MEENSNSYPPFQSINLSYYHHLDILIPSYVTEAKCILYHIIYYHRFVFFKAVILFSFNVIYSILFYCILFNCMLSYFDIRITGRFCSVTTVLRNQYDFSAPSRWVLVAKAKTKRRQCRSLLGVLWNLRVIDCTRDCPLVLKGGTTLRGEETIEKPFGLPCLG